MKRLATIVGILLALALTPVALAQTPVAAITVEGELVNANNGQPAATGLPLMLHTYEGGQMAGITESVTGPGGAFRFENVAVDKGRSFEIMATVGQTVYFSQKTAALDGQARLELPVTIYETTRDASTLRVEQMHSIVDFLSPARLQVLEVYVLSNEGSRTVEDAVTLADGQTASLRFTLPEGATDLSFNPDSIDQQLVVTADGFADRMGVPPGQGTRQLTVRYALPYESGKSLERVIGYPVNRFSLILPRNGVSLSGSALSLEGSQSLPDGRQMDIFSAGDLAAGQKLAFSLTGQPELDLATSEPAAVSTAPLTDFPVLPLSLAGLGLALAAGGMWWWQRRRMPSLLPALTPSPAQNLEAGEPEQALVLATAQLDEAYQAGLIPEERYRQERSELLAQLKGLLASRRRLDLSGSSDPGRGATG